MPINTKEFRDLLADVQHEPNCRMDKEDLALIAHIEAQLTVARGNALEQAIEVADHAYLDAQCSIERGEFNQPIRQTREAIENSIRDLVAQAEQRDAPVPDRICILISQYGDERADDTPASPETMGKIIRAIREHYAAQNDEILSLHRRLAGEKLRADQGWARAEAKSKECIQLRDRMAGDVPKSAGAPETCRSGENAQVEHFLACSPQADQATAEILSVMLWLYRRLPRCYGRPPTVERPILELAKHAGINVVDCLAERGPDPQAINENERGNDGP